MKDLVYIHFPDAELIRVVQDNLNTHTPWVLYAAFDPGEARRLLDHLEFRYTPKHGSWLDMAESEISMLHQQCLNRRIGDETLLQQQAVAREDTRNAAKLLWIGVSGHRTLGLNSGDFIQHN